MTKRPSTEEELSYHKITVATVRGRPYYNITCALRLMELQFDSLSPEEIAVSNAKVIITTQDEAGIVNKKGIVMIDTELESILQLPRQRSCGALWVNGYR